VIGTTDKIYDYSEGKGEKNNFTISVWRTNEKGGVIASGSAVTAWTDPPEFIEEGQKPSFNLKQITESSWGITGFHANIDIEEIKPSGATAGAINFLASDGTNYVKNYEGKFEAAKGMPKGSKGSKKAILVDLGNSYGFKYCYEWKE